MLWHLRYLRKMEILFPPAPDVAPQAKVDHGHGGGCLAEHAGGFELLLTVRTPQKQLAKLLRQLFFELAQ